MKPLGPYAKFRPKSACRQRWCPICGGEQALRWIFRIRP